MRIAIEIVVVCIAAILGLFGQGLPAVLWMLGYAIGFHRGRMP